jgi:hypothetical protein
MLDLNPEASSCQQWRREKHVEDTFHFLPMVVQVQEKGDKIWGRFFLVTVMRARTYSIYRDVEFFMGMFSISPHNPSYGFLTLPP